MPGLDEILAAFARLVEARLEQPEIAADEGTSKNFRCVDCVRCTSCRFCTSCEDCQECTYCDACVECERCTQCRELVGCVACTQSGHSAYCERCSYVTLGYECEDCVHCFACVGLAQAEFCVLNRPYPRREYFRLVNELRAALDAKSLEGWVPPWFESDNPKGPDRAPAAGWADPMERTGTWPPEDHRAAKQMDRAPLDAALWAELEEEAPVHGETNEFDHEVEEAGFLRLEADPRPQPIRPVGVHAEAGRPPVARFGATPPGPASSPSRWQTSRKLDGSKPLVAAASQEGVDSPAVSGSRRTRPSQVREEEHKPTAAGSTAPAADADAAPTIRLARRPDDRRRDDSE